MVNKLYGTFLITGVLSIGTAAFAGEMDTKSTSGSVSDAAPANCQGTDIHNCENREGLPRNGPEKEETGRTAGQDSVPASSEQSRGEPPTIGMDRDVSTQPSNGARATDGTGIAPGNSGR